MPWFFVDNARRLLHSWLLRHPAIFISQAVDTDSLPFQWGYGTTYYNLLLEVFGSLSCWAFAQTSGTIPSCFDGNGASKSQRAR